MRWGVVSSLPWGGADFPAVFAYRTFTLNLLVGQPQPQPQKEALQL